MEACIVGGDVVGTAEAGGVLELHIRKPFGDADGWLHIAERGGEDQIMASTGSCSITRSASPPETLSTKVVST